MYRIEVRLTLHSPLHIGAISPAGTAAMRGFLKDRDGWPYIPASAFKGRLRHAVERLSPCLGKPACRTHRQMCQDARTACPACQVFGSPWIAGQLRFVDFALVEPKSLAKPTSAEKANPPQTSQRFGVSLSRRRNVAEDQFLYTTELFAPGVPLVFHGELSGEITLRQAAIVVAGLRFLDSLGSSRSRGLGWLNGTAVVQGPAGEVVSDSELRQALEQQP